MDTRTDRALVYFKSVGQHGRAQHHAKQGLVRRQATVSAVGQEHVCVFCCCLNEGGVVFIRHGLHTSCGVGR